MRSFQGKSDYMMESKPSYLIQVLLKCWKVSLEKLLQFRKVLISASLTSFGNSKLDELAIIKQLSSFWTVKLEYNLQDYEICCVMKDYKQWFNFSLEWFCIKTSWSIFQCISSLHLATEFILFLCHSYTGHPLIISVYFRFCLMLKKKTSSKITFNLLCLKHAE